ncbi:hypothetical protein VNO78_11228 [Psophocarpus tetragonolobus]|uniref:Transmembrane protein n=1 Tax=Psophocarpus tetragonolobus TaxID=3891 RepID=A0AAN9XNG8_PSOTE
MRDARCKMLDAVTSYTLDCINLEGVRCEVWSVMAADWGPVVISVVLFVLLSPGLLFQLPAKGKVVAFGTMQTSGLSILVHTIIFFGLITIFLLAIGVHIYSG